MLCKRKKTSKLIQKPKTWGMSKIIATQIIPITKMKTEVIHQIKILIKIKKFNNSNNYKYNNKRGNKKNN